ncbi:MAG TPA: hypothetical protein DSN98_06495 [Thermoplasmata archaeon]|nr:MAG TPA: hypothetical protein DSN98_06495 [Thermoplasmata archaeon]
MTNKISHNKFNKIISIALITIVIVLVGICGCTTTPPKEQPEKTLLTISVGSQVYNYTLNQLIELSNISEQGSYINKVGKITGPNTYTGFTVTVLLHTIPSLPTNYTVHAIASDGYAQNYTLNEVNGHVMVYNETGAEIGTGNLTLIIAYKENGVFLNETTKGPLRIAFVDTQSSLTNSGLWLSSLVKIEII